LSDSATVSVSAVDADESDDYFMAVTDFIAPTRLFLGTIGGRAPEMLKRLPAVFGRQRPDGFAARGGFEGWNEHPVLSRWRGRTSR